MNPNVHKRERGAVLIVALVFLVILTMLGVTAMTGTTMELRMATNARDHAIALAAAEAALRDAEYDVMNRAYVGKEAQKRSPEPVLANFGVNTTAGTCSNTAPYIGLCLPGSAPVDAQPLPIDLTGISLTGAPSVEYGTYTGARPIVGVAQQPRYYIESLYGLTKPPGWGSISGAGGSVRVSYFRITARGVGSNPNTTVTVSEVMTRSSQ